MSSKSIKTEAIKPEINIWYNINFLQNGPFDIQHVYFCDFSIGQRIAKTLLGCKVALLNFLWDEFSLGTRKSHMNTRFGKYGGCCTHII